MRNEPTLRDIIIAILGSARNTRRLYSILNERRTKKFKKGSIKVTLTRLHNQKYLNNTKSGWLLTNKGKFYFRKIETIGYIESPFNVEQKSDTIITFDIPEKQRFLRNWLRNQI
ncbi:MAG: hypothetical protein AAB840_00890, partial [Patescibacteria group bacterium]